MEKALNKTGASNFPLNWVNPDYLPDSDGTKVEINLVEQKNPKDGLILLFYTLFGNVKNDIKIFNHSWWDYCLDTWNPNEDEYNYQIENKSPETREYLSLLIDSEIEKGYSGLCECTDWNLFLSISLQCLLTHQAPYSPLFFSTQDNFFFYFHHTGSIGFYYKEKNDTVVKILKTAKDEYFI